MCLQPCKNNMTEINKFNYCVFVTTKLQIKYNFMIHDVCEDILYIFTYGIEIGVYLYWKNVSFYIPTV